MEKREFDFNEIYELHYERIKKVAFYITKDQHLAEDIAQETFIKAYKKNDTILDKGKMGSWLSAIASRTAIDFLRKEKRSSGIPTEDVYMENECAPDADIERKVEISMLKEKIRQHLSGLKPEQRKIFLLKINRGMKEAEIAESLNINKGTVKTKIYQTRKYLRSVFRNEYTA